MLVRHTFLSLDPYMRGRLNDAKSYAKPQEVGAVMGGGTVGIVEASNNPRFQSGRRGRRHGRLAALFAERRRDLESRRRQGGADPGLSRPARHARRHRLVRPEQDHRAEERGRRCWSRRRPARSARWSASSRRSPARGPVGIAGGKEKCAYAVKELGYAACVDHKSPNFAEELKAALPNGIDGLFENVGGEPFQQALRRLNDFSRVAICGLIASYEGAPTALPDMRIFLVRRFKIEGFIVSDHLDLWPQAIGELAALAAAKKLIWRETIRDGLENAPQALVDLLHGENFGKMLVRVN